MYLKSLKPMLWIILFTFIIHLFGDAGEPIVKLWLFFSYMEWFI